MPFLNIFSLQAAIAEFFKENIILLTVCSKISAGIYLSPEQIDSQKQRQLMWPYNWPEGPA